MRTVCVLEHPEHFAALERKFPNALPKVRFYAASFETEALLKSKGISFIPFNDNILKSEWDSINTWARNISFKWFDLPAFREILLVDGVNMGDALSRPISHALIYALKTQLLVDRIFSGEAFDQVIVFEDYFRKGCQWKKTARSLNRELVSRLDRLDIKIQTVKVHLDSVSPWSLKATVRSVITGSLGLLPSPRCEVPYLGMGAISHTLPVLSCLARSAKVVFLDNSFQLNTWRCCRRENIVYRLMGSFLTPGDHIRAWFTGRRVIRMVRSMLTCFKTENFSFYGQKPVLEFNDVLVDVLLKYIVPRILQIKACKKAFEKMASRTLILHEDINAFRPAALAARQLGRKVVVMSHGIPPTKCDWSHMSSHIGVAQVIVNSEFEKEKYIQTGYDPDLLHVLGLSRFDRAFQAIQTRIPGQVSSDIVLYCPHMLRELSKHRTGYLGIHTPGALTEKYAIAVMTACKNTGHPLWIKLHDDQDLGRWKQLCAQYGGPRLEIFPHYADIFNLLAKSGLLVTTFSTVIIEAMPFDLNVISMNFTGEKDIHPYVKNGIVLPVTDSAKLEGSIRDCFENAEVRARLREKRLERKQYFCGPFDGHGTERAAEFIRQLSKLGEAAVPPSFKTAITYSNKEVEAC